MSRDSYPSDWDSKRKTIYSRDNQTCQNCGRSRNDGHDIDLNAHHIVPIDNGGSHKISNLVTMCRECHNAIHNDTQAPTANDNNKASDIDGLQDMIEFIQSSFDHINKNAIILYAHKDIEDIGKNVDLYNATGAQLREQIQEDKQAVASFDPDNNQLLNELGESVKTPIRQLQTKFLHIYDQLLHLDRLVQKYVNEASNIECQDCGTLQSEENEFCGNCGAALPDLLNCTECGSYREDAEQNFCKSCGEELSHYTEDRLNAISTTISDMTREVNKFNELVDESGEMSDGVMRTYISEIEKKS